MYKRQERDSAQPELLEEILEKGNLNRAFKRVKANKGAPGIDGITVEEIGAYLREKMCIRDRGILAWPLIKRKR